MNKQVYLSINAVVYKYLLVKEDNSTQKVNWRITAWPGPLVSTINTGFAPQHSFVDFRLSLASQFTSYGSRQTPFSTTKIAGNRLSLRGQVPVLVDGILLPPSWSRNMKWNMKRHCTGWPDVHIVLRTQHVFCS